MPTGTLTSSIKMYCGLIDYLNDQARADGYMPSGAIKADLLETIDKELMRIDDHPLIEQDDTAEELGEVRGGVRCSGLDWLHMGASRTRVGTRHSRHQQGAPHPF